MLKPVIKSQEIVISLGGKQTIAFHTFRVIPEPHIQ